MIYDPPSGWMYGFPKLYQPKPDETLSQTLLRDGYPQHELDRITDKETGRLYGVRFLGTAEEIARAP